MNPADQSSSLQIGLPPELIAVAFPFHFALDLDLKFVQVGPALHRICPDAQTGVPLAQIFHPIQPAGSTSLEWVQNNRAQLFLLKHRTTNLRLRGEFMPLPGQDILLFLGSPWFTDAADMVALGLRVEDFAIHDPVTEMLEVFQANRLALAEAKNLAETLTAQREELHQQAAETHKLALIAARTDNSIVLTDARRKVVWVNAGFTRLTGYTLEDVIGKTPGSVLQGPETDPATVQFMRQKLTNGEGLKVEIVNYSKTGRKYWLASEIQPIHDDAGRIINFMAIQNDITERFNAQRLLRETNALQHAMLEGAGYAIIATDPQGIIQLFNPAAERQLGYTAGEVTGRQSPEIFHDRDEIAARAKELTAELGREVKPGFETFVAKAELGQPDQCEWTYVRKDGARFPVLLSVSALFDERGKITGYLGVASDLTGRKRDEEKLRATLSELERINRVMMKREERVLELKREVNQMLAATGMSPAYPSVNENHDHQPNLIH